MPILRRTAGVYQTPKAIFRRTSGVYTPPKAIWRRVNGVYVKVWEGVAALVVTLKNSLVASATSFNGRPASAIGTATASVTGGKAPYSYLWVVTHQNGTNPNMTNSNTSTVTLRLTSNTGAFSRGTISCTVTDSEGRRTSVTTSYDLWVDAEGGGGGLEFQ